MPVSPILLPEDIAVRVLTVVRARYDFAVDGGAVGTISLTAGSPIPAGATIIGGYIDVITALASSGSATISCGVETATDVVGATAVASWTTGRKTILPALGSGSLTNSTVIRTTQARAVTITVGTAPLTAGKFDVVLLVVPPANS
jgi:hypothetical protein